MLDLSENHTDTENHACRAVTCNTKYIEIDGFVLHEIHFDKLVVKLVIKCANVIYKVLASKHLRLLNYLNFFYLETK